MENNTKKFWFFGSKLNTALLAILIVLMIIAIHIMMQNKEVYFPMVQERTLTTQDTRGSTITKNWNLDTFDNVYYETTWKVDNSKMGIMFTLPSGAIISYGGPQTSCSPDESKYKNFEYGISYIACVKNEISTVEGPLGKTNDNSLRVYPSPTDLKVFGDFVLKNNK